MTAPARKRPSAPMTRLVLALLFCASCAVGATLEWTMPTEHIDGTPLPTGHYRWEVAYTRQSATWVAFGDSCLRDTTLWRRVVAEAAPRVILSGYALAGAPVSIPQPLVISLDTPAWFWVRTQTGVNGQWSNPCRYLEPWQ